MTDEEYEIATRNDGKTEVEILVDQVDRMQTTLQVLTETVERLEQGVPPDYEGRLVRFEARMQDAIRRCHAEIREGIKSGPMSDSDFLEDALALASAVCEYWEGNEDELKAFGERRCKRLVGEAAARKRAM